MAKSIKKDAIVQYKGEDGVYVTVPEFNRLGNPHEGAAINGTKFTAGNTYFVHPDIGKELERILSVYDEQTLKLLMGKINRRALAQLGNTEFLSTE